MSDFRTVSLVQKMLNPAKRVNYFEGLVLGVDEFLQEQFYHMERLSLHNRSLHGYGTVCGLRVSQRDGDTPPETLEVLVSSGLAVDPNGREIRLSATYCARLNAWLDTHRADVIAMLGSPPVAPFPLSLYLTLCYQQCETDIVPVAGEPCRPESVTREPSRVEDSARLSLSLEGPVQLEEQLTRYFGAFLREIEITSSPGTFLTLSEMEAAVRGLAAPFGSPPELGSPPEVGSPPIAGPFRVHPDDAPALMRAAFRVWITEVEPALRDSEFGCATGTLHDCEPVLLAQLDFNVVDVAERFRVSGAVTIDERERPLVLNTRLLQEWLISQIRE